MKLKQLQTEFSHSLAAFYPLEERRSFFSMLLEEYLKMRSVDIVLRPGFEVPAAICEKFEAAVLRLKNFEPIQYILGKTEFFGLPFIVNEHTLVPRPETEELVAWIISDFGFRNADFKVLDIGTGSGCIAVSLAKNLPHAKVSALDISAETLKIAKKNAKTNGVEIDFLEKDILKTEVLPEKYDVIVSNPPYVCESEKARMQANVLKHEPHTALFVDDAEPLLFYRAISHLAKTSLTPGGLLFFEINEKMGNEIVRHLEQNGFAEPELRHDIFGKPRMVKARVA